MGDSMDMDRIQTLLDSILTDSYEEIDASALDSAERKIAETLNAINAQRRTLQEGYDEDLEQGEDRLRNIIETTPVGICITNEDGYFEYMNPTYLRLYGYEEEELVGQHFTIVVPPEHKEELSRLHTEFMGRRYELRGEWSVVRKDGSPMSIIADAAYIIDVDGKPKKVTFVLDITERKQLENTKAQVERMIRHDLRNPLNGVIAAAEILMTDELTDEQRDLCVIIRESGRKLDSMLSASMDLIQMEEGTYELTPATVDLVLIFDEVRRETRPLAASRGVQVVLEADGKPGEPGKAIEMAGEPLYLSDLFVNLVRNAVEASTQGDIVTIRIVRGDPLIVEIHNVGVVPDEMRDVFFERYATYGKRDGAGLGTYVAMLITRVHNGTIALSSTPLAGTTVTVTLPVRQQRPETTDQAATVR